MRLDIRYISSRRHLFNYYCFKINHISLFCTVSLRKTPTILLKLQQHRLSFFQRCSDDNIRYWREDRPRGPLLAISLKHDDIRLVCCKTNSINVLEEVMVGREVV